MIFTLEELTKKINTACYISLKTVEMNKLGQITFSLSKDVYNQDELGEIQDLLMKKKLTVTLMPPDNLKRAEFIIKDPISEVYDKLDLQFDTYFIKSFVDQRLNVHCKIELRKDGSLKLITSNNSNEVTKHYYLLADQLNLVLYQESPKLSGRFLVIQDSLAELKQNLLMAPTASQLQSGPFPM